MVKKAEGRRQRAFMEPSGGGIKAPPIASHQIKDCGGGQGTLAHERSPHILVPSAEVKPSALCPLPSAFVVERNLKQGKKGRSRYFLLLSVVCSLLPIPAFSQIAPDGTTATTVATPDSLSFTITGGNQAGSNLFHSFSEFSVPIRGEAFFNNAAQIENIFTRVTGNSVSSIDGLIRTHGTANLFLLNPNGIIFGPNASLDIGGSLVASTASGLEFADGTVFGTAPANPSTPLLNISVPLGLQYGTNTSSVQVQGSRLEVNPGQTLALLGGNVNINGGQLLAPGGRVELGSVAGEGTVKFVTNGSELGLSFPVGVPRGDVSITNDAFVGVPVGEPAGGDGSIAINARSLNISGESTRLQAGIASGRGSVDSKAGDIDINATEAINLDVSVISNRVDEKGVGHGGNVNITTGSLSVTNSGQIQAITRGKGDGGNVNITARDRVSFDGEDSDGFSSAASTQVNRTGEGDGGDINITTRELLVTGGATLVADTQGKGDAGNVNITAHDRVSLDGEGSNGFPSTVRSSVQRRGIGDGGDINITTRELFVTGGAQLLASTFGQGNAGNVNITAHDRVSIDGVGNNGYSSGVFSSVESAGKGDGGNINITTSALSVMDGAKLNARTEGQGNGGGITVNANTMDVVNGGQVFTTSFSSGEAGNITVNVAQSVILSGSDPTYLARLAEFPDRVSGLGPASGLFANTSNTSTNRGGDLRIHTEQLIVRDEAQVTVKSEGTGNAGNLYITANSVLLDNRGQLIAETASGEGGNINLDVEQGGLLLRQNSSISAKASGNANGGNITIDAGVIVALPPEGADGSDIIASAVGGNGGRIEIEAQGIFRLAERRASRGNETNDIDASSEFGAAGEVEIIAFLDPSRGLSELPANLVDATSQLDRSCSARGSGQENRFVITGTGGLPPRPGNPIDSPFPTGDVRALPNTSASNDTQGKAGEAGEVDQARETLIVEATGWVTNDKGEVVLIASAPTANNSWSTLATCAEAVGTR